MEEWQREERGARQAARPRGGRAGQGSAQAVTEALTRLAVKFKEAFDQDIIMLEGAHNLALLEQLLQVRSGGRVHLLCRRLYLVTW